MFDFFRFLEFQVFVVGLWSFVVGIQNIDYCF